RLQTPLNRGRDHPGNRGRNHLGTKGRLHRNRQLEPAADKFAYFTGANSGALADIKAKGRDIIAAADMVGLLGKLGPVFGGTPPSPTGAGVGLSDGDFNTIMVPGVYSIAGTWSNGPAAYGASNIWTAILVMHGRNANNLMYQTLYHSSRGVWWRYSTDATGATWQPWNIMPREVVGLVGQSSGIPTGAIIERGSNANGEYVRFADGTQICWGTGTINVATNLNNHFGSTSGASVTGNALISFRRRSPIQATRYQSSQPSAASRCLAPIRRTVPMPLSGWACQARPQTMFLMNGQLSEGGSDDN
ncbi:pyocin knob domain-containing protein, partial [Sinorhizobium meliloti]|uniref:pyocin knob domain-containing protein n=1 Tax=Rhizobium meliloti TaxID=382 RepID=UPI001F345B5B